VIGLNTVVLSGHTRNDALFSTTRAGTEVCSFLLSIDSNRRVSVRVNVYDEGLVRVVRSKLEHDGYVIVEGQLMNRTTSDDLLLLEVRAQQLIFV